MTVVRASHVFYVGITNIPIDNSTPNKLVPSKQLSFVTDPEEKRKIIGDVFMQVHINTSLNCYCHFMIDINKSNL